MYELADIKWGSPVLGTTGGIVQWTMDLSSGLDFDTSLYEQDDFEHALRVAFDSWEDVADINFVETRNDAEISVSMGPLSGNTVGLAELTYFLLPGTDQFIEADLTFDSDEQWSPFGETDLSFYAVAAHEIGHALGLLHVEDPTQLMNAILYAPDLAEGDIAGAQAIYGEAPPPVFETSGTTNVSFIERFFQILLSIFGIDVGSSGALRQEVTWADTDGPELGDIVPITEMLDENGEPFEIVTVVHSIPDPDFDWEGHPPGCTCGCDCGFEEALA